MGTTSHWEPGPAVSLQNLKSLVHKDPKKSGRRIFFLNVLSLLLMTLEQKVPSATKMNKIIRIFLGQLCT